jgi:hypothetical protein
MEYHPVKLYSSKHTRRLEYIAEIILGDIMGLSWELVTDKRKLGKNPVINYSSDDIAGSLKIEPATLLFEKNIVSVDIPVTQWRTLPVFFQSSYSSDIPFDIFAASFFLVTRYEEYLDFKPDRFGRFPADASLAYKNDFLRLPVVDLWAKEMVKELLKKYNNLTFKRNNYSALLTIDVDQPFAYVGKGLIRTIGGLIRDVKNSESTVGERYKILAGEDKDPYDNFDYIKENVEKYKTDVNFFFPVGNFSAYDKNPSWKNEEYRKLIISTATQYKTGLHPSFYSSDNPSLLKKETARLSFVLGREILLSRFHYIRLFTPASYRALMEAGIREDYSMGYPDEPGFRAGISRPYPFFDVLEDKVSDLRIIPYQLMDTTLWNYLKLDPDSSGELISNLIAETKNAGGMFVSIWHNTTLVDDDKWRKWRGVFEYMLETQKP